MEDRYLNLLKSYMRVIYDYEGVFHPDFDENNRSISEEDKTDLRKIWEDVNFSKDISVENANGLRS